MPRLRDSRTGVVVDVDDATATALGSAYEPAEKQQKAAAKTQKRTAGADKSNKKS